MKDDTTHWEDCTSIFSNGTEFELFTDACMDCTRYRNGKCRIYSDCIRAMYDKDKFPYKDLMDAKGGYGGKKCRHKTTTPITRTRKPKQCEGQLSLFTV